MAAELLAKYAESPPEWFRNADPVTVGFNANSGFVFLINDNQDVAMINDGNLEPHLSTPHEGLDGFLADILCKNSAGRLAVDDVQYLKEWAGRLGKQKAFQEWLDEGAATSRMRQAKTLLTLKHFWR
jgi:hypothetical protein